MVQCAHWGAIEIKPWQFEPWRRILQDLPFPRLLIADDVGLGKTTEAAIIISELVWLGRAERILIITPQQLTHKWHLELFGRFGLPFEIFNRDSYQRLKDASVKNPFEITEKIIASKDLLKRWEYVIALKTVSWDLVVIDECHHFTHNSQSTITLQRELVEEVAKNSPGLLLLSATPHSGRSENFKSLMTLIDPLFAQDHQNQFSWQRYIIRRTKKDLENEGERFCDRQIQSLPVGENVLLPEEKQVLNKLMEWFQSWRTYFPQDETQSHLRLETLRKRLSSSWNAFFNTLIRVQTVKETIEKDLLKQIERLAVHNGTGKIKVLKEKLNHIWKHQDQAKVIIFTEYTDTMLWLQQALKENPPLNHLSEPWIATIDGSLNEKDRMLIEQQFVDPQSNLRLLITTDTSAEGKDFQHACHHLIHFELPWSMIRMEQRNGRIDRLGQKRIPYIFNLILDHPTTLDQKILHNLIERMEQAKRELGSVNPIAEQMSDYWLAEQLLNRKEQAIYEWMDQHTQEAKKDTLYQYHSQSQPIDISHSPILPEKLSIYNTHFDPKFFKIKLEALGGKLKDTSNPDEFDLMLTYPKEQSKGYEVSRWDFELPSYLIQRYHFPDHLNPWRVTFKREYYLKYEHYLLKGGKDKKELIYLHPLHPVVQKVEKYFYQYINQGSYPVFLFKPQSDKQGPLILVEKNALSPHSTIIARTYRVWDPKLEQWSEIESILSHSDSVINGSQETELNKVDQLWNAEKWHKTLQQSMIDWAKAIQKQLQDHIAPFIEENKQLTDLKLRNKRESWINQFWSIDLEKCYYQIIAVLWPQHDNKKNGNK
ncbi:MAG: helicase-related protein [Pseudobdellovibrionaceae bacterium]|nr:helicase-related protein [Pseudobdellovibrionaceae bacterium]